MQIPGKDCLKPSGQSSRKKPGCQSMSPNVSRQAVKLTTLWTAAGFLYIMMANQQEQTVFVQADSGCSNNSG
jgi:hypothetical protein